MHADSKKEVSVKEIRKHSILMYLKQLSHSICAACEVRWDGGKNEIIQAA